MIFLRRTSTQPLEAHEKLGRILVSYRYAQPTVGPRSGKMTAELECHKKYNSTK